jgi:hypothetical protein
VDAATFFLCMQYLGVTDVVKKSSLWQMLPICGEKNKGRFVMVEKLYYFCEVIKAIGRLLFQSEEFTNVILYARF